MEYSNNFGSQFPNAVIPVGTKKDVDDYVVDIILQYNSYVDAGNTSAAYALYNDNKDTLDKYIVSANYFNRLEEEMHNLGIALLSSVTTVISATEPDSTYMSENSHWLQEY